MQIFIDIKCILCPQNYAVIFPGILHEVPTSFFLFLTKDLPILLFMTEKNTEKPTCLLYMYLATIHTVQCLRHWL